MNTSRPLLLLARVAALVVLVIAGVALGAWIFGAWRIATFGPNYVPMAPITALLFLLIGTVHLFGLRRPDVPCCRVARWVAAGITASVALAVLKAPGRLPWDNWFVSAADRANPLPIGRMSYLTACVFLLGAVALVTSQAKQTLRVRVGAFCAGVGLVIGVVAATGYIAGVPVLYAVQSGPMALLTAISFIALNGSLLIGRTPVDRRVDVAVDHSLAAAANAMRRRVVRATLAAAGVLAVVGFLFIGSEQRDARSAIIRELDAVANLKAAEISRWREERMAEGRFLMRAPFVAEDVAALAAAPESETARERVRGWLDLIKGGPRYMAARVFDRDGRLLLSIPADAANVNESIGHAAAVVSLAVPTLTDLHRNADGRIHMDLRVPLGSPASPIGTIQLVLNAEEFLFPMVQTWPSPSESAETILVRREGDELVYLNELRHQRNTALTLRRSMHETNLLAAEALRGNVGVREGLDYRGVRVLGAARIIPDTSWTLLAKVDLAELYEPVRRQAWQSGLVFGLLLGGLWVGGAIFWRQKQAEFLQRTVELERDRKALVERLAVLSQYANDIIVLMDGDGRVLEANDRAVAMYGYSRDEMRSLPVGFWLPESERAAARDRIPAFKSPQGAVHETVHQRRDGSTFPAEVNGRAFETPDGVRLLAVVRDITQRRENERQIDRLSRLYAALSHINQAIVHSRSKEELFQEITQVLVKSGRFRMCWIGWHDPVTRKVELVAQAGDDKGYLDGLKVTTDDSPEGHGPTGTAVREDQTVVCNDFFTDPRTLPWRDRARRAGIHSSISLPIRSDGQPAGALTVYASTPGFFGPAEVNLLEEAGADISFALENLRREERRREAEAALQASESRFRALFETNIDAFLLTNPADSSVHAANPAACALLGWSESELCSVGRGIVDPKDPRLPALLEQRRRTGHATGELRFVRKDGSTFEAEISSAAFPTPQGLRSSLIIRDITARKKTEARLKEQMDELRRWHEVTLGRETRVMELKREINALLADLGQPPRYPSSLLTPGTSAAPADARNPR